MHLGHTRGLLRWILVGLMVSIGLFLVGCNGDDNEVTQNATLTGAQQVPPVVTNATGTATVVVNDNRDALDATLTTAGFTSPITQATINFGVPGETGPVLFTIFNVVNDGLFPGTFTRHLTSANFNTQQPLGSPVTNFDQAVQAILNGNAYVSVQTVANPQGAIRGQLGGTQFISSFSGFNVVPAVTTNATGAGSVFLSQDQSRIGASVFASDFATPVSQVQIRFGAPGVNGPVMFTVFDAAAGTPFSGSASTSLTAANFNTQQPPGSPVTNFNQAVQAIQNGNAHFLITTTGNPNGELRGPITQPLL